MRTLNYGKTMLDILFEHLHKIICVYNLPIRSEDTLEVAVSDINKES